MGLNCLLWDDLYLYYHKIGHKLLLARLTICSFPKGLCCVVKDILFDLNGRGFWRFDKLCFAGQDSRITTLFTVYFQRLISVCVNYAAVLAQQMCNAWEFFINKRNYYSSGPLRVCTAFVELPSTTYLSNTPTNAHIYSFNNLKFTLKHLKRSYMFRSYDHPQGAYTVPC